MLYLGIRGLEFHVVEAYKAVDDGVDGEACGGAYLQLAADVAAVRHHGVDGDEEGFGYLLVGEALGDVYDDVLLPVAEDIVRTLLPLGRGW